MPEIKGTHSAQIEREQRGYQWIRSGVPGKNVAPPPQIRNWSITQQEQPNHPLPRVGAGKQGPNVAPPPQIKSWSVTVQEWPDHPQPYVRRGVAIPNVAAPPQIGAARTVQEWPDERPAFARSGIQGPNVAASPQIGTAKTVQEWPDHPQPYLLRGVAIPNPVPPPVAWGGVALRGTHSALIEREQLGYQWIRSGVPGPSVAPPPQIKNWSVTTQEQPDHPGPFLWKHYTVAVAVMFGPGTRQVITTQEQPHHPFGGTLIAIQGPDVGPPVKSTAITVEERPLDLQAVVRGSLFAAPITATPQGRSVTVQEQPDHPLPKIGIGIQGPNVGPPVTRTAIIVQEYPPEYQARTGPGIQGPNVAPPVTRTAITRQEQPDHPLPTFKPGIQGPNVAFGIGAIFTKQEQPDHPGPFLLGFVFPPPSFLPPVIRQAITREEQPDFPAHPGFVWPGTPPVAVVVPPGTRQVVTRQEQPDFPPNPGFTFPGTPPIFVPPPPVTTPPPGGGKRRKKGLPKYVSPIRTMTAGDLARAKIATKMRKKDITEEEMRFLLSLLDDED